MKPGELFGLNGCWYLDQETERNRWCTELNARWRGTRMPFKAFLVKKEYYELLLKDSGMDVRQPQVLLNGVQHLLREWMLLAGGSESDLPQEIMPYPFSAPGEDCEMTHFYFRFASNMAFEDFQSRFLAGTVSKDLPLTFLFDVADSLDSIENRMLAYRDFEIEKEMASFRFVCPLLPLEAGNEQLMEVDSLQRLKKKEHAAFVKEVNESYRETIRLLQERAKKRQLPQKTDWEENQRRCLDGSFECRKYIDFLEKLSKNPPPPPTSWRRVIVIGIGVVLLAGVLLSLL